MPESHPHGKDAGTYAPVVGDLVTYDGTFCGIHNEPDICFDAPDFDVGFIGSEGIAGFVVIMVNERFYTESGGFAVVGYLLVEDFYVVDVFEC